MYGRDTAAAPSRRAGVGILAVDGGFGRGREAAA